MAAMNWLPLVLVAATALPCVPAAAQVVRQAAFRGEVTMATEGGRESGCGIAFSGLHLLNDREGVLADGSVAFYSRGYGGAKGGLFSVKKLSSGQVIRKPLAQQIAWVKVEGGRMFAPDDIGVMKSDSEGYALFMNSFEGAADIAGGVIQGRPLYVAFTAEGARSEIYRGAVAFSEEQRATFRECVRSLRATLETESE